MLHLRRYLGALAVVLATYGVYALLAAPWLEPRAWGRGTSSGSPITTVEIDESFRELFEAGSWELDHPKIVETAQCTLLLRDYQPREGGQMEITPCTLIFYTAARDSTGDKGAEHKPVRRPIVLRAPQGAVLQFDRPLDVGHATVGRLLSGTLRGNIRIFSPPSRPGANDALELTTRNVKIDRERVYTPSTVDFRYGSSFGSGRDLTITLRPEDKQQSGSSPTVGGLSVLQLARVDRLHLAGSAAGLLPDPSAANDPSPSSAATNLPLEVRCRGPLVVDFEQNLAALDEEVEISRVYPQGPPDRLTCDQLIFHLVDRRDTPKAHDGKADGTALTMDHRQLAQQVERAIAVGSPVVLDAPQADTFAKAARVEYLAASKRIALEGSTDLPQVTLRRLGSEFEAREIEYEMGEPGRLGRLWSAGPGRLKFVPAAGQGGQTVVATWQEELTIAPHENNKVLSLKGRPLVQFGDSSFSAQELTEAGNSKPGEIYLWLREVPRETPPLPPAATEPQTPRYAILPDRMLATGRVEIDSSKLAAHTSELQAWFVHQGAPAQPAKATGAMFDPIPEPRAKAAEDQPELQKLDLTGRLIQLQLLRRGEETLLQNLSISGGVKLTELVEETAADAGPLSLAGERLSLRDWSSPNAKLEIHGKPASGGEPAQPAKVSARGLSLAGATIHLQRADNRLWIPGAGEATLPITEELTAPPAPLRPRGAEPVREANAGQPVNVPQRSFPKDDAASVSPTRPLKVTWQEAFEFDGQKGIFSGQIEARGQAEFAAGEELTFTLNERIDFAQPQQDDRVDVAKLHFAGGADGVHLHRVLYDEQRQPSGVDNAHVRNLDIDRTTGELHAAGPGEVWTVRRDLRALRGSELAPREAEEAKKLAYVCVTFQGQIVGNLNRNEIVFQKQVDTIYGQVNDFGERIVATRAEDLGETGVHVRSDTLTLTEMSRSPDDKWIEINAAGNTLAEGVKFVAQAGRISYTSDKDQLVIEAGPYAPAEFWHRQAPGGDFSHMKARRILFQRSTGALQVDDTQSIDIGSLPLGGKPPPKLR